MTLIQEKVLPQRPLPRDAFAKRNGISQSANSAPEASVHPFVRDASKTPPGRPLVVDLDGTLVRSDLLVEAFFSEVGRSPQSALPIAASLMKGKPALKHRLADPTYFDPATLPYDQEVLACIHEARAAGRKVYLASASHENLVREVADHLGLFDGWFATNLEGNLAGERKAERLVEAFGDGGFDYVGNDAVDLPVWQRAAGALAIRAPRSVARKLTLIQPDAVHLAHEAPTWRSWAKLLRVHQYAKNALLFVPLLAGHVLDASAFLQVALAAIAFCLCASSVYIVNDLVDLNDDRRHHSKSSRPLASGAIPIGKALLLAPVLLIAAVALAAAISLPFLGVLAGYYLLTTAYSFFLKRVMVADVITLAGLYTVRVIAGAVAINAAISVWLVAFFMAWFLSLALMKRCVELVARRKSNLPDGGSRDYEQRDIEMIASLAAASGFNAITVFVLYASSDAARASYQRPELLWLAAPILAYWIARALMLASRGKMHDDPVVFALKDRVSLFSIAAAAGVLVVAT